MATYRRIGSSGIGSFWTPKDPGTAIEGVLEGQDSGDYGPLLLIREPTGVLWKVPITAGLERAAKEMQEGLTYKLTFEGLAPTKSGKTMKRFVVDVVDEDNEASATDNDEVPF
jgi:hypothetical protein